jgi:hypothetical protein
MPELEHLHEGDEMETIIATFKSEIEVKICLTEIDGIITVHIPGRASLSFPNPLDPDRWSL